MAFEKFVQKARSFRPVIAIWSKGQIGFNQGAVNACKIKEGDCVVFFYDADEKKIGFTFTSNQEEEGAFKLKFYKTGAFASAKAFLDYHQIDHKTTVKYDLIKIEEENMVAIDLKEGLIKKGVEK